MTSFRGQEGENDPAKETKKERSRKYEEKKEREVGGYK